MKLHPKNGIFSKTVSLATAVLFTFETFLSAAPLPEVSIVSNASQKPGWFVNFEVPESLGRIESRYFPENFSAAGKIVIHIQDAHAHPEAQRHIEGLLENFLAQGLDLGIAVEGAAGPLRPDMLKVFSEDQMNLKLADYLLNLGELTGVERFALKNQQDVLIHGAEQAELYRRSYQAFEKVKLMEPEIKPVLDRYAKEVERLQMALLAKEVHEYVLRSNEWHHHKDASFRYFDLLTSYARDYLKLDFNDTRLQFEWPSFVRLSALQKIHQELNSENASRDFEKISEAFNSSGNNFPENSVENWNFLSEKLANIFSSGKESLFVFDPRYPSVRSVRNLMELLKRTASERGIDLSLYPDFLRKAGALILRDEIDARVLFQEVEKIEEKLETVIAVSDKQKEAVQIGRHFRILEKMLSLSVTRQEYEVFLDSRENFQPASFAQRFTALDRSLNVQNQYPELSADALDSAEEFYRLSRERDEALLEGALSMKGDAVILVTGGFHSQGVTDLMKERGIPYVVVAPKMTQGGDENLYEKVMLGSHADISDLSGSLSDALVKMMLSQSSQVYGELHPHHRVEDQTILILRAVNEVLAALQDQGIPQESVQEEILEWVRNAGVLEQSDYELKFDSNRAVLALRDTEDRVLRAELRSPEEGPEINRRRFIFAAGASVLLGSASSVLGQVRNPEIQKDILKRLTDNDSGWFERWTASRDLREALEKNGIKGVDATAILRSVDLGFSQSHTKIKKRYVGDDIQYRIKELSAAQKKGTNLATDEKAQERIKEIINKYLESLRSESSIHDELVKIAKLFLSHENLTVVAAAAKIILEQSFEAFSGQLDDFDKNIYKSFLQGDPGETHRDQVKQYFEILNRRRAKDLEAARDRLEVVLKAIKPQQLQSEKDLNSILEKIELLKKDAETADKKRGEIDGLIFAEEEKLSPKSRTAIHEGLRYKLAQAKKDLTTKEKREKARDLEKQVEVVEARLRELRADRQTVVVQQTGFSEKDRELSVEKVKQQAVLSEQTKNVKSVEALVGRLQFALEGLARPELRSEIDPVAAAWIEQYLPEGAERLKVISAIKEFRTREYFDYERMGFKEKKTPRVDFLTEHVAEVLPAIAGELPRYLTRIETLALAAYERFEIGKLPLAYRAAFVLGVFAGQEFSAVQSALKEIFQSIRFEEHQFSDELTAAEYVNMTRRYSESISRETILENMLVRLALNQFVFQVPMTARRALEKENLVNELFRELQKPGAGKILTPVFLTDLHGSTKVGSFVAFVLGVKNYSGITSPEELERRLVEEWKENHPDQQLKSVDEILAEKRILFVGGSDYVDRGPKPYWGFRFNKWLREKGILKFINGNHDLWKAWNISGLHFRVHDTLREIAVSGKLGAEHFDEHFKRIDRFVTKTGWDPEKDKTKFEELELQERALVTKFLEAAAAVPPGDALEALIDVYANEIIDSGTNPNHSLEWWAREWGIHGGWFDTFLDQINEELINEAIARANKRLEEDPEHKAELLTILSNADDLPEEIQPYVSRWKERLESGKPIFSFIDASLFSQGEEVRKLKAEIERIKKENAEIRTVNEKLAAQKRFSEMTPQKKVPSAFEMTAQAAEREMGVLKNAIQTLNGLIAGLNLPEPSAEIVTQQNYRSNPAVIETALWDWKNFRLIYTDIYENVYVHGIIPVDTEKFDFAVDYKDPYGREFHGIAAIERIQFDVRNFFEKYDTIPDTPEFRAQVEAELGPAFQVLNEWYSDVLGLLKPESIQGYLKSGGAQKYPFGQGSDFSPREFNGRRGTIHVGHVESAKLRKQKLSYWIGGMEGGLLHGDFEMSEGYSGLGAVVTWFSRDEEGRLRGFARYGYSESVSFYSSKIKEAEKKLKTLQEELGKVQKKEEVLAEEIASLEGKIGAAQSEIAGLKERREALAVAGEKIEDITFHDDLQSVDAEKIRPYVQGDDLAKYFINRFLEENVETYQDLKILAAKEKRLERAAYYERREAETRARLTDFRKNETLRLMEALAAFSELSGQDFGTLRQAIEQVDFKNAGKRLEQIASAAGIQSSAGELKTVYKRLDDALRDYARSELRSGPSDLFEELKQTTAKLVATLSRGDEIEETPSAFLVLGHPHLPNYLEFARQWKEIQGREGVEVPVVIAGGVGRGTLPLAERILAHYSAQERLSGDEHDWLSVALENLKKAKLGGPQPLNEEQLTGLVKETELMKFLLVKEGIPESAITVEAKPSWDTIENFKFSEQVIEGLVKGRKNPLIAIVSAPYLLTRVESSARKYWAKGLELGWKLAKYKTHEVDLSGASEQDILDLAAYLAGNPKKYAELYPRLFFRNELEMGEDPYFGEPRKFSSAEWDTLHTLQNLIENFFEIRGEIYDEERNKLLPARSLEEISASRPELRERKEALAILTDAIVLTEEKLENVTDPDLQEANMILKSKITELSALNDEQVNSLKWEEFILNPTAGEYVQQALRARLPKELARVFSEKIRYLSALGRPGSGKGTLLGAFIEQLNRQLPENKQYKSLIMGDYFRGVAAVISGRTKEFSSDEERRKHEELEKTYWQFAELVPAEDIERMQAGGLMSSATAIRIVNAVLDLPEYHDAHGIFFDGFPRTLEQQDALDNGEIRIGGKLLKMDLNLIVDVGEDVLIERIRQRAEEAARLGQPKRADDTEEVLKKRLVAYDQSTLPLTEKLRSSENTLAIEGNIPGALPREGILAVRENFWKKLSALLNPSESEAKELHTEANKQNLAAQLIKLLAKQDTLPETVDLIVVFGSKDTEPAREAARLYHAGKAPRILVSGRYFFNVPEDGSVEPEARIYERILLEAGVPREAILVEDQSHHMGENAEFSYQFLEERGLIPETAVFLHTPVMQARGAQTARDFFEQKGAETVFYDHAYSVPDVFAMSVTEAADFVNVLIGEVAIIDEFSPNTPRAGEIRVLRDQLKRIAGAEEGLRHELREQEPENFALWQSQYETARSVLGLRYEDQRWVAVHMVRGIMEALSAANASPEVLEAARGFLARDLFYFDESFNLLADLLGSKETGVSEGQPGLEISIVENIEDPENHFLAVASLLSRKPKGYVYEILLGGSPEEAARLQRLFQEEYAYTGFSDRYRIAAASSKDLTRVLQSAAGSIYNEVRTSSDASNLAEFIEGYVVFSSPNRELVARSPLHGAWLIHDDLGAHPGLIAARMDRSVSLASGQLEAELIRELGEIKALRKVISASRGLLAGMNLQLVQQLWDKEIAQRWFYKSA